MRACISLHYILFNKLQFRTPKFKKRNISSQNMKTWRKTIILN